MKTASVPHKFGGAKSERLFDKVIVTLMQTAEVTICIISKDCSIAFDSYRMPEDPSCRRQHSRCHCPGHRMFCSWSSTTTFPFRNQCHLPLRGNHSFRGENIGQLVAMNPCQPGQPSRRPGVSRFKSVCFLQALQYGPSNDGDRANLPTTTRKV